MFPGYKVSMISSITIQSLLVSSAGLIPSFFDILLHSFNILGIYIHLDTLYQICDICDIHFIHQALLIPRSNFVWHEAPLHLFKIYY